MRRRSTKMPVSEREVEEKNARTLKPLATSQQNRS